MLASTVYEAVLAYLRKDKRGLSLQIEEFNKHAQMVDKRLLIAFCSRYEDDIEISSHMGFLKVIDYPLSLSGGIATLPSNYFRMSGDPWCYDTDSVIRFVDVVTSKEHSYRQRDFLTQATTKYPTCVIGAQDANKGLQIRVYPITISKIYVTYVRDTQIPYLDYYVNNSTLRATYMAEGAQNIIVPSGCTYRDGTTGTKNSLTKNFEWDEHELPWLVAYFLQAMGAAIPDELLLQVGIKNSNDFESGKE